MSVYVLTTILWFAAVLLGLFLGIMGSSRFLFRGVSILLLGASHYFLYTRTDFNVKGVFPNIVVIASAALVLLALYAVFKLLFRRGTEETGRETLSENMFQKTDMVYSRSLTPEEAQLKGYAAAGIVFFFHLLINVFYLVRHLKGLG